MLEKIFCEGQKTILYSHSLVEKEYEKLSEILKMDIEKLKDITNEEVFTPRIVKSDIEVDWEMFKIYYPIIKKDKINKSFSWSEILSLIIMKKDEKILIIDENHCQEFFDYTIQYTEKHNKDFDSDKFFISFLHKVSQTLYKHVRFLINEHENVEKVLRESQGNEKLISLSEIEQGFYIFNIALRNLEFVLENIQKDEEFLKYEDYITKILQEINFTTDLSSSYCEICKTTRETYSSYIGNNMNITMKFLAAATILITIPNMIFGFYGMNIRLPFQDTGFFALLIIIVVMIILMIVFWKYLKKKIL